MALTFCLIIIAGQQILDKLNNIPYPSIANHIAYVILVTSYIPPYQSCMQVPGKCIFFARWPSVVLALPTKSVTARVDWLKTSGTYRPMDDSDQPNSSRTRAANDQTTSTGRPATKRDSVFSHGYQGRAREARDGQRRAPAGRSMICTLRVAERTTPPDFDVSYC